MHREQALETDLWGLAVALNVTLKETYKSVDAGSGFIATH